ncbi:MAG: ribbon-helix-helix protein, CopG family [Candidatus Hodarchaeaceae archaeon]|nr:ribbon-helix-helix protein, CopG family [Candidatus Hodarchaeaceae archaeon]
MVTTIQVHEDVLERLNALKKEMGARSTEEVIKVLLKSAKSLKKSHFGSLPGLRAFEREEIDRLS